MKLNRLTVILETAYCNLRNETKRNEMKICNLRNGNMLMICKICVVNFVKSPLRSWITQCVVQAIERKSNLKSWHCNCTSCPKDVINVRCRWIIGMRDTTLTLLAYFHLAKYRFLWIGNLQNGNMLMICVKQRTFENAASRQRKIYIMKKAITLHSRMSRRFANLLNNEQ